MAKARTRKKPKKAVAAKTEPIRITLTPAIKATLKSKGRFKSGRVVRILRVVYVNGRFSITRHQQGRRFVPSNSCFA